MSLKIKLKNGDLV